MVRFPRTIIEAMLQVPSSRGGDSGRHEASRCCVEEGENDGDGEKTEEGGVEDDAGGESGVGFEFVGEESRVDGGGGAGTEDEKASDTGLETEPGDEGEGDEGSAEEALSQSPPKGGFERRGTGFRKLHA